MFSLVTDPLVINNMLEQVAIFLAAAVLIVPLFKKLGLGTVLGYLIAGILIGPWCLGLVTDVDSILHFAEIGVVFLLFIIGLELQPLRLWVLRHVVFGLGSAQVIFSAIAITLIAQVFVHDWKASIIIGLAFALSSTAFILQTLIERRELATPHGREAFAVLLFQDIAVIPLLAIIPLLGYFPQQSLGDDWLEILRALGAIAVLIAIGRSALRLIFRGAAYFGNREIFTAAALLVVIGTALLMEFVGLSMSLGAFLAGVLLADSEFRHQIMAEIEPFKGLLLGLFFIAVGMSVNLGLVFDNPLALIGLALLLLLVKFTVMYVIDRARGIAPVTSQNTAIALAAGGEFAFVLFNLAYHVSIIDFQTQDNLFVIVTLSMMASPLLFFLNDVVQARRSGMDDEPVYDRIDEPGNPVVIIGYGRVGQIVSRILHMYGFKFTALENNPSQVDFVRKFGSKIYYGDATQLNLLRAAKVEQAKLVVLCINEIETSMKIVNLLREHYPAVPIYARAHNRFHCYKLLDMGVKILFRDTFHSSLKLSTEVLKGLGIPPDEAVHTVEMFRKHDEELLLRQHAIYQDESAFIKSVVKSREELQSLFESDTSKLGE